MSDIEIKVLQLHEQPENDDEIIAAYRINDDEAPIEMDMAVHRDGKLTFLFRDAKEKDRPLKYACNLSTTELLRLAGSLCDMEGQMKAKGLDLLGGA